MKSCLFRIIANTKFGNYYLCTSKPHGQKQLFGGTNKSKMCMRTASAEISAGQKLPFWRLPLPTITKYLATQHFCQIYIAPEFDTLANSCTDDEENLSNMTFVCVKTYWSINWYQLYSHRTNLLLITYNAASSVTTTDIQLNGLIASRENCLKTCFQKRSWP